MAILLVLSCIVYSHEITALPAYWYGTYQGTLEIRSPGKPDMDVPIELVIKPLENADRVTWQITYGEGEKKSVRPYELVALPRRPNYFELDEKSGIKMQMHRSENKLLCLFKISNSLLHVEYEIKPKDRVIHYQISTFQEKDPLTTSHEKNPQIGVDSYRLLSIQSAILKPVDTSKPGASKK
ncbi:MAG TPA: hypothetical protein PLN21_21490 [Gemmatales bacterium]|nr:hypothetical protein [Gemmatales bacterium]